MRISDWSSDVCSSDLHPDTSLESRPATRPITVRNLLTHTAGLGYTIVTQGPLLKEYDRLGLTPGAVNAAVEAPARPARPNTPAQCAARENGRAASRVRLIQALCICWVREHSTHTTPYYT